MAVGVFKDGRKAVTTAATAVPLAATKTLASWIMLQPFDANTGQVRLGAPQTTIATDHGFELNKGDSGVVWYIPGGHFDLNLIYLDSDNNGDGVKFVYVAL